MEPSHPTDEPFAAIPDTPRELEAPMEQRKPVITRFRVVVAVLALCGVVCFTAGAILIAQPQAKPNTKSILSNIQQTSALKVSLTALRPCMQLNGKTNATVYIVPRASYVEDDMLEFDAILTQPGAEVTETYVLLDNRAYWSKSALDGTPITAQCLTASQIPPIELMQGSMEQSHVVSAVVDDDGEPIEMGCEIGQLLELKFAGETFVLCKSRDNTMTHGLGDDLTFTVEYISDPTQVPDIVAPTNLECPVVRASLPRADFTPNVASSPSTDELNAAPMAKLGRSRCGCKGPRRPCLFVHGVGTNASGPVVDSLSETWGNIQDNAPCCTSTKFVQMETIKRGWTDGDIQDELCRYALKYGTNSTGNTVGELILVSHSMGNLITGGALATGRCKFSSRVTWVSLAGPMQGSKTSNLVENKCTSCENDGDAFSGLLGLVGQCPVDRAYAQLKHQSTVDATLRNQYLAAQTARADHPNKNTLCGESAFGLVTTGSVLQFVSSLSEHDTVNDGVVDVNSCSVGVGEFGTSTTSTNYKASVNHFDASFRNGDGWWGDHRKPIKWFQCVL